jgi:CBS-domain-containing membrane protein
MTAQESENEDSLRLHRSDEHVEYCKRAQDDAIRALHQAGETLKRAREKRGELFQQCQDRAVARRKAGLIANNPGY